MGGGWIDRWMDVHTCRLSINITLWYMIAMPLSSADPIQLNPTHATRETVRGNVFFASFEKRKKNDEVAGDDLLLLFEQHCNVFSKVKDSTSRGQNKRRPPLRKTSRSKTDKGSSKAPIFFFIFSFLMRRSTRHVVLMYFNSRDL